MRYHFTPDVHLLITNLGAVVLCICVVATAAAQQRGSRPIEFSEPKDGSIKATNRQDLGSQGRRLSHLEDDLSKTFNFFQLEDSMGGSSSLRPPARGQVLPRQTKSTGLSGNKLDWLQEDSRFALPKFDDTKLFDVDAKTDGQSRQPGSEKSTLLETMRGEDWLLRGTMGNTFFEIPITSQNEANQRAPWEMPFSGRQPSADANEEGTLGSKLDQLVRGNPASSDPGFNKPSLRPGQDRSRELYDFGQPMRMTLQDRRRETFKDLLGMAPTAGVRPAQPSAVDRMAPRDPLASTPAYLPSTSLHGARKTSEADSLQPVGWADRGTLYAPIAVTTPRPSVLDPIEVEPASRTTPQSGSGLSSPLYQRPQRSY